MVSLCLGITAFVLYLIYDINSFTRQWKFLHGFFLLGTGLLGIATGLDLWAAWNAGALAAGTDVLLLAGALICFALLIYCLFFALPFQETYAQQNTGRRVYRGGAYALCRHPGILCFFGTYLLLGLAALPERTIRNFLIFSLLNLAYAWFQDWVTFPKIFCDYADYRKQVPFLIPTKNSIAMARNTWFPAHNEEDAP